MERRLPLKGAEPNALLLAARRLVARTTGDQRLTPNLTDPAVVERVAALLREPPPKGRRRERAA